VGSLPMLACESAMGSRPDQLPPWVLQIHALQPTAHGRCGRAARTSASGLSGREHGADELGRVVDSGAPCRAGACPSAVRHLPLTALAAR
jgi:hypothetical protein